MARIKNGRRQRNNGKFVVPTVNEMKKDRQDYIDAKITETIRNIKNLRNAWCNFKVIESIIKFRGEQLDLNEDLTEKENAVPKVLEQFNGAVKPVYMLEAEILSDFENYKNSVAAMNYVVDGLKKEYEFTDEDINLMKLGKFDTIAWKDIEVKKDNVINTGELEKNENYIG